MPGMSGNARQNDGFLPPEQLDELAPELDELDSALLRDGGVWRRRLPEGQQAAHRALAVLKRRGLPPGVVAGTRFYTMGERARGIPRSAPLWARRQRRERGREWVGIAAMMAVVVLIAALLHALVASHEGERPQTKTPLPSATGSLTADTSKLEQWTLLSGFSGHSNVALAPSNPHVAYDYRVEESTPSKFGPPPTYVLARTEDGGATWQPLPLPIPQPASGGQSDYGILTVSVSPLDPQWVYVTFQLSTATLCDHYGGGIGKSGGICAPQFVSTDGGRHWRQMHIPATAPQERGVPVLAGDFAVQGNRLYVTIGDFCPCSGAAALGRMAVSTDGGVTWRTMDDALIAKGLGVDSYAVAPSGATLFAIAERVNASLMPITQVSPPYAPGHLQLWRSDDAGASWKLVGDVPHNAVRNMWITRGTDEAHPLLYFVTESDGTTGQFTELPMPAVAASLDGGKTWTEAPATGIPSGYTAYAHIWGVLPDGSVLLVFMSNDGSRTIFAWKAGAANWRQVTPPFTAAGDDPSDITSLLVISSGNRSASTIYLVTKASDGADVIRRISAG